MRLFWRIESEKIIFWYSGKKNTAFLDQEIEVLKNAKNRPFPKAGLVHSFCPKFKLFLISVFEEIMSEKIVSWYSG